MSKVRSLFVVLFFVLTAPGALFPGAAHAQAKVVLPAHSQDLKVSHSPASQNCNPNICNNNLTWPGNTYGGQWTVEVSFPSLRANQSDYWHRYWILADSAESSSAYVEIGMEEIPQGSNGICEKNTSGTPHLWYFDQAADLAGTPFGPYCHPIPNGDVNNGTRFLISTNPNVNPGNCVLAWFHNFTTNSDFQDWYSCNNVWDAEYSETFLSETIHTVIPTNLHEIWGTDMSFNQWQTGNYVWHPQQTPSLINGKCTGNGCPAAAPPHTPNWYWFVYPGGDSSGGQMFDCSYNPPATACNIGH